MLTRLSVRTKILGTIGVVLTISLVVAAVAVIKLSSLAAVSDDIGKVLMPRVAIMAKIRNSVDTYRRSELQLYLKNSEAEFTKYYDRMDKMQEDMKVTKEAYGKLNLSADEKKHLESFDNAWNTYVASARKVVDLVKSGNVDEAQKLTRGEGKTRYDQVNQV